MASGEPAFPRRVLLIGFMASGKSTVGPLLAERLGWHVDARVQLATGLSPRGATAVEHVHVGVAELAGLGSGALSDVALTVVAPDESDRSPRHQPGQVQLQRGQRHARGMEQMRAEEDPLLARVEQREFLAIGEPLGQRGGIVEARELTNC